MKLYHKVFLYHNKLIQPYIRRLLGWVDTVTLLAAIALIAGLVYEHGFIVPEDVKSLLDGMYRWVWAIFLVQATAHITLAYRESRKKYKTFTWILNGLLFLTLIPVIFHEPASGALRYFWLFLHSREYHLILLLILSFLQLSSDIVHLLGRRTNPSRILAGSFLLII